MGYVFISCASRNQQSADLLRGRLNASGIETWMAPYDIPAASNYETEIHDAIKNCSCFLVLITEVFQQSPWIQRELECAITYRKLVLPVVYEKATLDGAFKFSLSANQFINIKEEIPDDDELNKIADAAGQLLKAERKISDDERQELLYSQIIDLQQGDSVLFCQKLCELIELLKDKLFLQENDNYRLDILRRICDIYKLYWKNGLGYGAEYRQTALQVISAISQVSNVMKPDIVSRKKKLLAALALQILYEDKRIRDDCIDVYTGGDVRSEQNDGYSIRQAPFISVLTSADIDFDYDEEEQEFIAEIQEKILKVNMQAPPETVKAPQASQENIDSCYQTIADYFSKGNDLFSKIDSEEVANDFYECLLLSYERLKNYCLEVDAKKTYSECVVKISELKQAKQQKAMRKANPSAAERGIKALLGLTMPKSGTYDAFISYKHYDEDRAHRVHSFLQQNLKEVFFDKESLPNLSESDYEHAVMAALDRSKHFIVIISNLELLESSDYVEGDWVRREMRAFNTEIQEGRKKGSNFIILASDEVCDKIFAANKGNIDIMWRWPEIIRFSEFEKVLAKYIK